MAVYSVTLNRQRTGGVLEVTEDIFYGGVRVGGVQVVVTPEPGAKLGQLSWARSAPDVKTTSLLQQEVDVSYDDGTGAQVVGHIEIVAMPDPDIGHSVSVQTSWSQPIPFEVDANPLA